jgi:hypothetical protein
MSDQPPRDDEIEALLRSQFDGPLPDAGFSERVMQQLPARRRRVAWPLWAGVLAGVGACWWQLLSAPLLHAGWRDWSSGQLSVPAIILLTVVAGISLLASWWSVAEADNR